MLDWPDPFRLHLAMQSESFEWELIVKTTMATRLMNAFGKLLPDAAWHNPSVLKLMERTAGPLLGLGRIGLQRKVPNGQHFVANPRVLWTVVDSHARLAGEDFGPPGPVYPQARLGDFWIPQQGIVAMGQSYFDPFDPTRHSSGTSRS